jgi:arginyl-tRNA synthetase
MFTLDHAKEQVVRALRAAVAADVDITAEQLEKPPQPGFGDLSFPCCGLAKALKQAPPKIAAELAAKVDSSGADLIESCTATGPYLNFRLSRVDFAAAAVADVLDAPERYAMAPANGRKVMVEYFSANTHKEVHIGHLRNMAYGLAVCNLLRASGDEVIPVTYIGDIGAHVAKCLWGLKRFHAGEMPPENRGKWLGAVYAEATRRVDEDESLKAEVAEVQRRLEARDSEWTALWDETREWSLGEMKAVCSDFGIEFRRWYTESEVEERGKALVAELEARGIVTESEGAKVVDLADEGLGVFLVLKTDGSALYSTKELALAELKDREYPGLAESYNVVDVRQSLYFKQFFATLKHLGLQTSFRHLGYEFVTLPDGAMSSRKGNVIAYEDLRDEVIGRVLAEISARHPDWDEARRAASARVIAHGAMKFWLLKQGPDRPIVFEIKQALAFDGFTGPYVQYAHARLASILRKGEYEAAGERPVMTDDAAEFALVSVVADLPSAVSRAAAKADPSLLAQYLFDLAEAVNAFYRDASVLNADEAAKARRLTLCAAAKAALKQGLGFLGIEAPEEM